MKYSTKLKVLTVALASALGGVPAAYAEDAVAVASADKSPHTLSTNIGFFTDYTFRGISLARERGAVQGGIDYSHSSGFYLGAWATNMNKDAFYGNTVELDIYGGYVHTLAEDLSLNLGFLQYFYPDGDRPISGTGIKGANPNTTEINAALSYKYFTLKHSYALTNLFGVNDGYGGNGNSRGSGYTELNVNYKLPIYDVNLALHVGRQTVHNYSQASYTDWLVGVNKDFSIAGSAGWNAGLNYTTTNASDSWYVDARGWETGNDRFIGYIKRTF
jgi:uncharacterized protein (TIGR02001 family)